MPRYDVERSIEIDAGPEKVFEVVADYGTWTSWSPWLCAEPNAKVDVTDDPASVGSVYSWEGEIVGQGEIEHKQLEPGKSITDEIRFIKPFRSHSDVGFDIEPAGDGTRVTWWMRGSLPWFLFWMRSQIEIFIGMDYERGLRMLKEWIETGEVLSKTSVRGVESVGPLRVLGVRKTCVTAGVGTSMEAAFAEAKELFERNNLALDGEVVSVYHKFDLKAKTFDFTSGFSVPDSVAATPDGLSGWSIPEMRALCIEHVGSYENLGNAWSTGYQYARYKKLKQSKVGGYEIYLDDPCTTPHSELRTEICMPLK